MSEIININFDFNNENKQLVEKPAIHLNADSKFNNAPGATYHKVMSKFAQFGCMARKGMFDGLGHDLTQCESYEQAMSEADLNYTGEKKPIYLANGSVIPDNFAVVKSDTEDVVLGVVGNQYQTIGNMEAFSVAGEIVNEGHARYELGGPCFGARDHLDYSKTFLVLRGDDFEIAGDNYESFVVFNNSFDGSGGIKYQVICQRLVCLNGMVRYLGGKKNQLQINIQHTKSAGDRIKQAQEIVMERKRAILLMQKEAQAFINTPMTRAEYEQKIIPLILKNMKLVEKDKDRERGQERIDRTVAQLIQAYNAADVQNFAGTAWQILLALSDFETHAEPLRNTGNKSVYLNRISKGMLLTSAAAEYIADRKNLVIL
jgi:phage/plasmid-like protein (TIGR03299 family)